MSELEFPWTERGTPSLLAANKKYFESWVRANSRAMTMPDSPIPLRSAYLRMEDDGKPALVIVREGSDTAEVFQLRPAQVAALAHDVVKLMWRHFDLVKRK